MQPLIIRMKRKRVICKDDGPHLSVDPYDHEEPVSQENEDSDRGEREYSSSGGVVWVHLNQTAFTVYLEYRVVVVLIAWLGFIYNFTWFALWQIIFKRHDWKFYPGLKLFLFSKRFF